MVAAACIDYSPDGLASYLVAVYRIPRLSVAEELIVCTQVQEGRTTGTGSEATRRVSDVARRRLIEANLRLVIHLAKRYQGRGLDLEDLIQAGNEGLLHAVDTFDVSLGNRFSTYAYWWIRQAVTRSIEEQGRTVRLPAHIIDFVQRLGTTALILEQQLQRSPLPSELAGVLGTSVAEVVRVQAAFHTPQSLTAPLTKQRDGKPTLLADLLPDPAALQPIDAAVQSNLQADLTTVLATLPARDRYILERRYGLGGSPPLTLAALGQELGITCERVRQLAAKALLTLRQTAESASLYDYLK